MIQAIGPRGTLIASAAAYLLVFVLTYIFYFVPIEGLEGYSYHAGSALVTSVVLALALLPASWLPSSIERPSQASYWLLYLLVYIPVTVLPLFLGGLASDEVLKLDLVIAVSFLVTGWAYLVRPRRPAVREIPEAAFWGGIVALSCIALGGLFSTFGVPHRFFSLEEVYEIRASFSTALAGTSRWIPYLINWQAFVIGPFLVIWGISRKRPVPILAGLISVFLVYLVSGYKILFVNVLLVATFAVLLKSKEPLWGFRLLAGTVALFASAIAIDAIIGQHFFTSWFMRRLIYTPGLVSSCYFQFFQTHPQTHLADSVFRAFMTSPYTTPVQELVATQCLNHPGGSANGNYLASAFAAFGYLGVVIFGWLLGLVFWVFDSAALRLPLAFSGAVFAGVCLSLVNSALQTSFLTYGLVLAIALVFFAPTSKERPC